jgi:hypothetical protein
MVICLSDGTLTQIVWIYLRLILLPQFNPVFGDRWAKLRYGYGNVVSSIDLWRLLRFAVCETRVGRVQ